MRASLGGRKQAVLFCKKEPKNFCSHSIKAAAPRAPIGKSFLVLFYKKELLP
jgi:hypothetical protein